MGQYIITSFPYLFFFIFGTLRLLSTVNEVWCPWVLLGNKKIVMYSIILIYLFNNKYSGAKIQISEKIFLMVNIYTAQKMKFSIKDFSIECDQICRKLGIRSHLLKEPFIDFFFFFFFFFCAVLFLHSNSEIIKLVTWLKAKQTQIVWGFL